MKLIDKHYVKLQNFGAYWTPDILVVNGSTRVMLGTRPLRNGLVVASQSAPALKASFPTHVTQKLKLFFFFLESYHCCSRCRVVWCRLETAINAILGSSGWCWGMKNGKENRNPQSYLTGFMSWITTLGWDSCAQWHTCPGLSSLQKLQLTQKLNTLLHYF